MGVCCQEVVVAAVVVAQTVSFLRTAWRKPGATNSLPIPRQGLTPPGANEQAARPTLPVRPSLRGPGTGAGGRVTVPALCWSVQTLPPLSACLSCLVSSVIPTSTKRLVLSTYHGRRALHVILIRAACRFESDWLGIGSLGLTDTGTSLVHCVHRYQDVR